MKISLIIPAYNEARRIESTLDDYYNAFTDKFDDFEIIVEMDGCTDKNFRNFPEFGKIGRYLTLKAGGGATGDEDIYSCSYL